MQRTLDLLDELPDVVERKARPQIAEIPRRDLEGLPLRDPASARQAGAQSLVDDLFERSASPPRFRLELRRNVVIEGQRRPHIMMLWAKRHDVNPARASCALRRQEVNAFAADFGHARHTGIVVGVRAIR